MRGSVHLEHQVYVINMPPVLTPVLSGVPATMPAATGVNAIQVTPEMESPAQVNYS